MGGGVQTPPPPPAGGGKSRGPAGRGLKGGSTAVKFTIIPAPGIEVSIGYITLAAAANTRRRATGGQKTTDQLLGTLQLVCYDYAMVCKSVDGLLPIILRKSHKQYKKRSKDTKSVLYIPMVCTYIMLIPTRAARSLTGLGDANISSTSPRSCLVPTLFSYFFFLLYSSKITS